MKLEDQVCSLNLAKRLKELNVKQESLFYWVNQVAMKDAETIWFPDDPKDLKPYRHYSAFTVAELGELLPERIVFEDFPAWPIFANHLNGVGGKYLCAYRRDGKQVILFQGETEADCRAKMLIYLIEKGIVKP